MLSDRWFLAGAGVPHQRCIQASLHGRCAGHRPRNARCHAHYVAVACPLARDQVLDVAVLQVGSTSVLTAAKEGQISSVADEALLIGADAGCIRAGVDHEGAFDAGK